jgi:archaellum component FlaC
MTVAPIMQELTENIEGELAKLKADMIRHDMDLQQARTELETLARNAGYLRVRQVKIQGDLRRLRGEEN